MNRPIKFRGKRVDNGDWVYGSLLQSEIASNGYCKCAIAERFADSYNIAIYEVNPETIGQYTGLKDKHGKELYYDSDLVKINGHEGLWKAIKDDFDVPVWSPADGVWGCVDFSEYFTKHGKGEFEIIGNLYDTPELITTK